MKIERVQKRNIDNLHTRRLNFIHGALVLTIGLAIVKIVGALFKIPLKHIIGEYGMGLFNVAYNFYGPIHSLSVAGFPIAIAKLVSENYSLGRYNDVRQIKKASFPILTAMGIISMSIMIIGAPAYCGIVIDNPNALLPMFVLAPAILFGCLSSIYRGYYEGLKDMYPMAISEVIEAASKLIIGLTCAIAVTGYCSDSYNKYGRIFWLLELTADEAAFATLSFAASGAILGVTAGSMLSALYLWVHDKRVGDGITSGMYRRAPRPHKKKAITKRLVKMAIPIAVGSIAINVAGLIDTTFLQSRIAEIMETAPYVIIEKYRSQIPQIYIDNPGTISNFLYGCYTLAFTIFMLVPTMTQAFGISALPNVTEAWIKGDRGEIKGSIEIVVKLTALFALPAGFGISALSFPISVLLYGDNPSTEIVSGVLVYLGIAATCAAFSAPLGSMLQAVGRVDLPVKIIVCAMILKTGANYFLCGIPEINIIGAGIGTLLCYFFVMISEIIMLSRVSKIKISVLNSLIKPFFCAVLCAASGYICEATLYKYTKIGNTSRVGASIMTAIIVYIVSLLLIKAISAKEIAMLPHGQKIAKALEKFNMV